MSDAFHSTLGRRVAVGNRRTRRPVAAKTAFATAGAIGGSPGSPTPPGGSSVGTMCTSIVGISAIAKRHPCREPRAGESLDGSRAKAVTVWPFASNLATTARPVPPVGPKTMMFMQVYRNAGRDVMLSSNIAFGNNCLGRNPGE